MPANTKTVQSRCVEDAVQCPACGHADPLHRWELLEASANPEQAQRLASGSLFVHACSACGKAVPLDYPLLYVDRDRQVCAYYPAGEGDLDALRAAFDEATMRFKGVELSSLRKAGFALRVAGERHQLVEKVALWQAGFDDRLVELLKHELLAELAMHGPHATFADAQFMQYDPPNGTLEFMLFAADDVAEGGSPEDGASGAEHAGEASAQVVAVPRLAYDRLAVSFGPEVLAGHDCPAIDASWADEVLDAMTATARN